ncbi:MAG: hypothetical protein COU51_02950 [Parcubacteria group bacterium CG10_big_fil_rev_8_21_14_0_10_36_14]|nr:MAG: hypothetical protein COU51_02950 [Parcubacteria group bacterium CG10_big_fil_rev_8_21_14_0_10_36_14]
MVKKLYTKIKLFYEKYERLLLPGTLVFGVIVDFITFKSIQINYAFIILGLHILFVGAIIAFLNFYDAGLISNKNRVLKYFRLLCPLGIQFSFGALLSACFIFYFFSGSLYVSWPFILLIVILMISNEVSREYYLRARVQISIYFFLLFSVFAIILPFVLEKLGAWIFLSAGALSLLVIFLYITFLSRYIKSEKITIKRFAVPVIIIFIFINALYFFNVIPPMPLSLKDSVIGHSISRSDGEYTIAIEPESFLESILPGQTIHKVSGEAVVVYTAIFAPGNLATDIVHHWQYKENGKWVSMGRFSYSIAGGRAEGYRGYSIKNDVPVGKWRVDVETARGQVLGRVQFDVVEANFAPLLVEIVE